MVPIYLAGLPSGHISYVRNIGACLPLFLFNYSDRKLHGIYEAASHGQMNISSSAWTDGGLQRTPFPAQVLQTENILHMTWMLSGCMRDFLVVLFLLVLVIAFF